MVSPSDSNGGPLLDLLQLVSFQLHCDVVCLQSLLAEAASKGRLQRLSKSLFTKIGSMAGV
jgi:hypothetical protein